MTEPPAPSPDVLGRPRPIVIGGRTFDWGSRTFVMGIVNVTPDSFSGDGLLRTEKPGRPVDAGDGLDAAAAARAAAGLVNGAMRAALPALAVRQAAQMVEEGADIVDVGGESTRPGHLEVDAEEEIARVIPAIAAVHAALPDLPISADTSKVAVAERAVEAGAAMLNDVWGVREDDSMARLAAERGVPLVLMHNRAEARYERDVVTEVIDDLERALERAAGAGLPPERVILDPGFGFGKTPRHNLAVLRDLGRFRSLGCAVLLGASRKSTLGKVLGGLPPEERLEATLATTALGIAYGVDVVRVHDVLPNVRVARMCDAVVRGYRGDL